MRLAGTLGLHRPRHPVCSIYPPGEPPGNEIAPAPAATEAEAETHMLASDRASIFYTALPAEATELPPIIGKHLGWGGVQ